MRHSGILTTLIITLFLTIPLTSSADTQWNVGVSGGDNGIEDFYISVGNYYDVPEKEVVVIHDRGIHEEELPVVFFLAQSAHVSPRVIVDLRLKGMSWMDITLHYGLAPKIYYVPVKHGPPYGNAYGHYKKHPKGDWGRNDLRDRDIVNQVNLKFMSEHYQCAPDQVMKYRSEGKSFTSMDRNFRQEKKKTVKDPQKKDQGKYNKGQDPKYDVKGKDPKNQGKKNDEWMNQGKGQKPK